MSDKDPVCKCHAAMGNDFWFLPIDRCLFFERCHDRAKFFASPTACEMIEQVTAPRGELDPIRGGVIQ